MKCTSEELSIVSIGVMKSVLYVFRSVGTSNATPERIFSRVTWQSRGRRSYMSMRRLESVGPGREDPGARAAPEKAGHGLLEKSQSRAVKYSKFTLPVHVVLISQTFDLSVLGRLVESGSA